MREQAKPLEELVKELPPEFREEVRDFVEFLLDVIGNKVFGSSPQAALAMMNTQIVQTSRQFHETV